MHESHVVLPDREGCMLCGASGEDLEKPCKVREVLKASRAYVEDVARAGVRYPSAVSEDGQSVSKQLSTHYFGCWRYRKHHPCAVALVEELAEVVRVLEERYELSTEEQMMVEAVLRKIGP